MKSGSRRRPAGRDGRRKRRPCALDVQLLQVVSVVSGDTVPFISEPVMMSCWLGVLPRPGTSAALLGQAVLLPELVVIAVQVSDVLRDHDALLVVPGSVTDAVLRVHRGLSACRPWR